MAWWRGRARANTSEASGRQLWWRLADAPGGGVRVTAGLRGRIPGADFPHLCGLVLREPYDGPLPEGWTMQDQTGGTEADGSEIRVLMPLVAGPIRNLAPGETFEAELPFATERVVGAAFGSLTNRLWVETGSDHLWLLDHARGPRLTDWAEQIGSDPLVRRSRLVVDGGRLGLEPIEELLLSELWERDGES